MTNHGRINAPTVCDLPKALSRAGLVGPATLVLDDAVYQRCALVQGYAALLGVQLLF